MATRPDGTVKLVLDLRIAAQYLVFGTALDPNLLGVSQLAFGQLDNTHSTPKIPHVTPKARPLERLSLEHSLFKRSIGVG